MAPQTIIESSDDYNTEEPGEENRVVVTDTEKRYQKIQDDPPAKKYAVKKAIFRTYQILWYFLGVIEVLLGFRVFLKILGANPEVSGFAFLVYSLSNPFALPFQGIVPASYSGNSIFEWSTIIAIIFYWIAVWGIIELFQIVKPTNPHEVETSVDNR